VTKEACNTTQIKIIGAISAERGLVYLKVFTESMDTTAYLDFLKGVLQRTGIDILLIQDNVSYHVSAQAAAYYSRRQIEVVNTPVKVPQLNAIELYWAALKHRYKQLKFNAIKDGKEVVPMTLIKKASKLITH